MRKLNFGGHKKGYSYSIETFKKLRKYIGDLDKHETADINNAEHNFDFNIFPYPFDDNTFDEIYAGSVIDHLDDYFSVMNELYRITKGNGIIKIVGPFYNCANSYIPTHKQHFTYLHFYSLTKKEMNPDFKRRRKCLFVLERFITIPGMFGKFIPDIKFGKNKHIGLRYLVGMLLGDVVRTIYVELRVIK